MEATNVTVIAKYKPKSESTPSRAIASASAPPLYFSFMQYSPRI